ncbi:hypothetical protein JNB91_26490 [Rhizobium wenxiniae]|uniref:hypothetical protein n=1 Tax=Rhizobium wenxiniae TaxID=1737357 RepID=UPI001C6E2298|nr:hypothetical protein [Rhizobium wenxiniae]MBW9091358.1 hypothetical protein [Rhizobium wenxiniae]
MSTTSYLPMILLAIFACGAALTAGFLILRSVKRTSFEQGSPAQVTQGSLDQEGRAGNAERPRKKFGSATMILVGTFSTVAVLGIFVGAIIIYGGLIAS